MAIYKLKEILIVKDNYRSQGYPKPGEIMKSGIPFVKTIDFSKHGISLTKDFITKEKFNSLPAKGKIQKGSLLISAYGTIDISIFNLENGQMSSGVKELDTNEKVHKKFLYYWLLKNICNMGQMSSVFKQLTINEINNTKIDLPNLFEQQKIIDIIEQNEKLFLSFSNCVRIDTFEHVKFDMKSLIDIIEPIESLINNLQMQKQIIKDILKKNYDLLIDSARSLASIIKNISSKWEGQKYYFATNSIGEFEIYHDKMIDVTQTLPSRANISPISESFILSKLLGENKVMFFHEKPIEVFSTGFFNFSTDYVDHLSGFLISDSFKIQKNKLSTGTTMQAINNSSLESILLKHPLSKENSLTKEICKIDVTLKRLNQLKNALIVMLIK